MEWDNWTLRTVVVTWSSWVWEHLDQLHVVFHKSCFFHVDVNVDCTIWYTRQTWWETWQWPTICCEASSRRCVMEARGWSFSNWCWGFIPHVESTKKDHRLPWLTAQFIDCCVILCIWLSLISLKDKDRQLCKLAITISNFVTCLNYVTQIEVPTREVTVRSPQRSLRNCKSLS